MHSLWIWDLEVNGSINSHRSFKMAKQSNSSQFYSLLESMNSNLMLRQLLERKLVSFRSIEFISLLSSVFALCCVQDIINLENLERMEKYCSLVAALENGDFDRQQEKDSDCTSGDRMQSQNSTESCKFPFSSPPLETKSFLSTTPKSHETRIDSSSTDEPDDKHKSFTRRKTALLATETASLLLLNPKKSRLHSLVVPNSFEHQFLANSHETKAPSRRVVPRQTSLAKIWDTVDSDEEDEDGEQQRQQQPKNLERMEMKNNEDELEDEAYRRSIALCQEVSLGDNSSAQMNSLKSSTTWDPSSNRVQNPMTTTGVNSRGTNRNLNLEGDVDNEEEEDEIRAIRIEEAIWNKHHSQPQKRTRKESFAQYVDRMLSNSTTATGLPHSQTTNKKYQEDKMNHSRDKSIFSTESEVDEITSESRLQNGRAGSTSSRFSHWLRKSRGSCHQENTTNQMEVDVDLEMGGINFPRESMSYLSDCLYSHDDQQKSTLVSFFDLLSSF